MLAVDRLEVQHPRARGDVGALGRERQLPQKLPVESAVHGAALAVAQLLARAALRIGHPDLRPGLVAEANRQDADARLGRGRGGVARERAVILPVRDQQDRPRRAPLGTEAVHGLGDRRADLRASARHALHARAVEDEAQEPEVGREGREHAGAPGERDQAHLIAVEEGEQIGNFGLGALQAVGRRVLCQH